MSERARLAYIDIAKGIAILCMVLGHLIYMIDGRNWCTQHIKDVVHTFHMPLFFFVAGFFLSDRKPLPDFVKDKAKRLLIPYVIGISAILVGRIMEIVFRGADASKMAYYLKSLLFGASIAMTDTVWGKVMALGPVWFLTALFIALCIVRSCMNIRYGWAVILVLASFALIWTHMDLPWLPFNIFQAFVASVYVYLGWRCYNQDAFCGKLNKIVVILGGGAFMFEAFRGWRVSMAALRGSVFSFTAAVFISAFVLWLSRWIEKVPFLSAFLRWCGINSLVILVLHHCYLMAGGCRIVYDALSHDFFVNAALLVAFPLIATMIYRKAERILCRNS